MLTLNSLDWSAEIRCQMYTVCSMSHSRAVGTGVLSLGALCLRFPGVLLVKVNFR